MKILIAEDDSTSRKILEGILGKWGYGVVATADGLEAWEALQGEDPPPMAIVDWLMPRMDGLELCRKIRRTPSLQGTYVLLLTGKRQKEDVVAGLDADANDYVRKPFDREELRARIQVGARVVELQAALARSVKEHQETLSRMTNRQEFLGVCRSCKKIRDERNHWQLWEVYVSDHRNAKLILELCPACEDNKR